MNRLAHTIQNNARRKARIRKTIHGTAERPRMTVFISLQHVHVQIIDDNHQKTLVSVTTETSKKASELKSMTEKAAWAGQEIAVKAKAVKVKKVVLDRNGRLYHGKIKALAEAARENGLEF